ncbi:MAG: nickel pincer cofactor biosynthesis protein LarB [Dehalococcoidia bacterium]|nr:nickel pincer cofactor biosynthesis protein LarB [Dehalococcoidia bacterium]
MVDEHVIAALLNRVKAGEVSIEEAVRQLQTLPYEDIGFAKIDHHRELRRGFPEVVFGQGKTPEQIAAIAERLAAHSDRVLVTRAGQEAFHAVRHHLPEATYNAIARAIIVDRSRKVPGKPGIVVVSGGTSDIPVAEEAAVTAELMGNSIERVFDVGVAGIHRLLHFLPQLRKANVVVAVAGMEGALPSVVSGLVSAPVIAVPTSIGYGASFNGLAPLLAMLNSCSAGVAVVNIDNGFGAGYLSAMINENCRATEERSE